ncbi:hypothetical protein CGCF413_v004741 [Colletotrichum fructicola]|nr:hypothetical protein CGCF413_v004741 [Colletotrichum fructicola]
MERWNELFLEAMTTFKHTFPAPKGRSEVYSIRTEPDWEAIYEKLEKAQEKYQSDGGRVGWFRKKRRSAADNASVVSEVVGNVSALVPDTVFSTPVFGVVQLLLDAVNKGAEVRAQASEGLDGLIPIFSDVELLLAVYPVVRFGKTLGQGSYYGSELVQSLQTINQKAEKVVAEATKSYQFETRLYSQETMRLVQKVHYDIQKTNFEVQTKMASMYTNVMVLLDGHTQKRDRELEKERERGRRLAVEVASLRVENTFLRSTSPGLQHTWGPYTPPRPQNQPALEWVVTKEMLLETLRGHNADIDECFALSKASDFPSRERAHAQQIVGNRLFQDWIASRHSTKLLDKVDAIGLAYYYEYNKSS